MEAHEGGWETPEQNGPPLSDGKWRAEHLSKLSGLECILHVQAPLRADEGRDVLQLPAEPGPCLQWRHSWEEHLGEPSGGGQMLMFSGA